MICKVIFYFGAWLLGMGLTAALSVAGEPSKSFQPAAALGCGATCEHAGRNTASLSPSPTHQSFQQVAVNANVICAPSLLDIGESTPTTVVFQHFGFLNSKTGERHTSIYLEPIPSNAMSVPDGGMKSWDLEICDILRRELELNGSVPEQEESVRMPQNTPPSLNKKLFPLDSPIAGDFGG